MSNDSGTPSRQPTNSDSEQDSPFSHLEESQTLAGYESDTSTSPIGSVVAERIEEEFTSAVPIGPAITMSSTAANQFKLAAAKRTVDTCDRVLFKRGDRTNLDDDKLNALCKEATRSRQSKFSYVDVSNKSDDVLADAHAIDMLVKFMKSNLVTYDMHSVFTIVYPSPVASSATDVGALDLTDQGNAKTSDLFSDHTQLTAEQVAASNVWYNEWADDTTHSDNLKLTQQYLINNVDEDLAAKTLEDHEEFTPAEQGGPLFFFLMLQNLLSNSREAALHLENKIKTLKISTVKGEDISKVVSHLRGALRRLIQMSQWDRSNPSHSRFFIDMNLSLVKVFQTTSVDEFNNLFASYQTSMELKDLQLKVSVATFTKPPDPFDVFSVASAKHLDMVKRGLWTGINTSGTESVFLGGDAVLRRCFNCNQTGCSVEKCPKPKNAEIISANRKLFWDNIRSNPGGQPGRGGSRGDNGNRGGRGARFGRGGRGGRGVRGADKQKFAHLVGKFAPPSRNEKNCRVIDGKAMRFNQKGQQWVADGDPPDHIKALITSTKPSPADTSSVTFSDEDSLNSARRRMANASKSIQATLAGLTSSI